MISDCLCKMFLAKFYDLFGSQGVAKVIKLLFGHRYACLSKHK